MDTTDTDTKAVEPALLALPRWHWLVLCVHAFTPAALAAVDFEPEISVGVARTDNVTLAAEDEQSETVYQLIPAFRLTQSAARVSSDVAYRIEGYRYDERSDSDVYHRFDSDLSVALDPDNFFIELGARRDQTLRDPQAPIPRSNLPISTNRVDRNDFYLGPEFIYDVGGNATVRGSYRRSWIRYDDDERAFGGFTIDFDRDRLDFSLDNYRRQRGFTWAWRYASDKTKYELFPEWEYRQATVELGSWVGPNLRVFASGGKESAWDMPLDPSLEDTFWEAGFATRSGSRLNAEFAAGERTFGSSRRGALDLALRRGSMRFAYVEQPRTQGRDPYRRGGLLLPDEPEDFLTRAGRADRYISKRLQWNLDIDLRRTGLSLSVFDEAREDRTQIDGTPLADEAQTGVYMSASRAVGARTEFVLSARRVHREFGFGDERDFTSAAIAANYRPGSKTRLSLEYSRSEEDANDASSGREYTANVLSFLFTRTF